MNTIKIDNLDPETATRLQMEAERRGLDVPTIAAQLIREGLHSARSSVGEPPYHDLDHLAGTWSKEQHDEFASAVAAFAKVDEDLWK